MQIIGNPVFRAMAGYVFLLFIVRVLGRRPGGQLTPFEYVLIFFIGGMIIQATVTDDRSMTNAVCTVITVGLLHRLIALLKQHFPRIDRVIDGTPLVLLDHGTWETEIMQQMRIQDTDAMAAARAQGLRHLGNVKYAILERNGAISIIKNNEENKQ